MNYENGDLATIDLTSKATSSMDKSHFLHVESITM